MFLTPLQASPSASLWRPKGASDELYAEIIIPLALPKNYTWSIPAEFQQAVKPGIRVEVQLKNKRYAGIIKKLITEKPEAFEPRPIIKCVG